MGVNCNQICLVPKNLQNIYIYILLLQKKEVWKNMRVSNYHLWVNYPFKYNLLMYIIIIYIFLNIFIRVLM